jgi:hypothetical protein
MMHPDMTISEILEEAARLVRGGWTKGAEARSADGDIVHVASDEATQFCVLGALQRVMVKGMAYRGFLALNIFQAYVRNQLKGGASMSYWNDQFAKDGESVAIALENCASAYKE